MPDISPVLIKVWFAASIFYCCIGGLYFLEKWLSDDE